VVATPKPSLNSLAKASLPLRRILIHAWGVNVVHSTDFEGAERIRANGRPVKEKGKENFRKMRVFRPLFPFLVKIGMRRRGEVGGYQPRANWRILMKIESLCAPKQTWA